MGLGAKKLSYWHRQSLLSASPLLLSQLKENEPEWPGVKNVISLKEIYGWPLSRMGDSRQKQTQNTRKLV